MAFLISGFTLKSNRQPKVDKSRWREDPDLFADIALRAAKKVAKQAILRHHQAGHAVPIWRRGKIMGLAPDGAIRESRDEWRPLGLPSALFDFLTSLRFECFTRQPAGASP